MSAACGWPAVAQSDDGDPADAAPRLLLADPHRRQILRLVRGGELAAGEIASHFDATQQAVSHHLQVLAKSGLLRERRDGARRSYVDRSARCSIRSAKC